MTTLLLITYHIILVAAVYCTAYRTGYGACADETRRQAEAQVEPLREILERLNLDTEALLDDKRNNREY